MKIAIDARALSWAGIGRYTRNLLAGLLKQQTGHHFLILARRTDKQLLKEVVSNQDRKKFSVRWVEETYYSWREQTSFLLQLYRIKADLVHFTHFNVPYLYNRPYLVTVHDVTRFIFPGQQRQSLLQQLAYEYVFGHAVESARGIITVSESTKRDLKALPFRLPREPRTILEGISKQYRQPVSSEQRWRIRLLVGSPDPYLLFVGVWMNHKNIGRLIEAFKQLSRDDRRLRLVITGRPKSGYQEFLTTAQALVAENKIVFVGQVPEALMPALYHEAACFVFPSLYEGFGLPVLEAVACQTPVVASNVSALPEVLGPAAEYVNPESVADIVRGVRSALEERRRRQLVKAGEAQAKKFSWDEAARQHIEEYEAAGERAG